jgi:hypothetical protein
MAGTKSGFYTNIINDNELMNLLYDCKKDFVKKLRRYPSKAIKKRGLKVKITFSDIGFLVGGFIGFLARPSGFLVGQLPFETVITRGIYLKGMDQILVPLAQRSFDTMLISTIIGTIVGYTIDYSIKKIDKRSTISNTLNPQLGNNNVVGRMSSWKCARCGEEIKEQFDSCWKCGTERDDTSTLLDPMNKNSEITSNAINHESIAAPLVTVKKVPEDTPLINVKSRTFNWKCTRCGEEIEEQFDSCWKCGTERDDITTLLNPTKKNNKIMSNVVNRESIAASSDVEHKKAPEDIPLIVELGQTIAQVEAILGKPQKIMKLGPKTIYIYPDLKVVFINGEVADVQ